MKIVDFIKAILIVTISLVIFRISFYVEIDWLHWLLEYVSVYIFTFFVISYYINKNK